MIAHQSVAVSFRDRLSILRITTSAPFAAFAPDVAISLGFILSEDGDRWEGGITDAGIADEITRAYPTEAPVAWRRIDDADLPQIEGLRDAWVDDGKVITIDMSKARMIVAERLADAEIERARRSKIASNPDVAMATTPEQLAAMLATAEVE